MKIYSQAAKDIFGELKAEQWLDVFSDRLTGEASTLSEANKEIFRILDKTIEDSNTVEINRLATEKLELRWARGYYYQEEVICFLDILSELRKKNHQELLDLGYDPEIIEHNYKITMDLSKEDLDNYDDNNGLGILEVVGLEQNIEE